MTNTGSPAPISPTTLASVDGQVDLGIALGSLGFDAVREMSNDWHGSWLQADAIDGSLRVLTFPDDAGRVEVIGWDGRYPGREIQAWSMTFSGATPIDVVAGAIAIAVGKLSVR